MERKVTEWGCMQALIDFDGWRRWKELAEKKASEDPEKRKIAEKEAKAQAKAELKAMFSRPPPSAKKDGPTESATRKDSTSGGSLNTNGGVNATSTDQPPARRSHKGNRSTSGSVGSILGTTLEVDEKDV